VTRVGVDYFAHVGICVAELERALRFYRDVLGFKQVAELRIGGEPTATLLGLPGMELHAVWLDRDGRRIELMHYPRPGAVGAAGPRPMNQRGLTHLALRVSGIDGVIDAVEAAGGRVLERTRVENPAYGAQLVFVTDPDGTLIELVEMAGDPTLAPGDPNYTRRV
jgi:catechol 2,3-dioxygenase-like lactoylglutathione lyase family enzyme